MREIEKQFNRDYYTLFNKTKKVIESCKTEEQLRNALKYEKLSSNLLFNKYRNSIPDHIWNNKSNFQFRKMMGYFKNTEEKIKNS